MTEVRRFKARAVTYTVTYYGGPRTVSYDNLDAVRKRCRALMDKGLVLNHIRYQVRNGTPHWWIEFGLYTRISTPGRIAVHPAYFGPDGWVECEWDFPEYDIEGRPLDPSEVEMYKRFIGPLD